MIFKEKIAILNTFTISKLLCPRIQFHIEQAFLCSTAIFFISLLLNYLNRNNFEKAYNQYYALSIGS